MRLWNSQSVTQRLVHVIVAWFHHSEHSNCQWQIQEGYFNSGLHNLILTCSIYNKKYLGRYLPEPPNYPSFWYSWIHPDCAPPFWKPRSLVDRWDNTPQVIWKFYPGPTRNPVRPGSYYLATLCLCTDIHVLWLDLFSSLTLQHWVSRWPHNMYANLQRWVLHLSVYRRVLKTW